MRRSYRTLENVNYAHPWIEIHGYNIGHPYGILSGSH
jgi:hypothetical protein